jgi:hypothetical protein
MGAVAHLIIFIRNFLTMKLLSTFILMSLSSMTIAHTGDHHGIWHDHGAMAQIFVLAAALGYVAHTMIKRNPQSAHRQDKINNATQANFTGPSFEF